LPLDVDTVNEEIVYVTEVSGDTLTISRGQSGTGSPGVSGVAHTAGATVKHVLTSDDLVFFRNNASPVASFRIQRIYLWNYHSAGNCHCWH
jgi:hypothetical protein